MSSLSGKRILILEDEPVIGFALEDMVTAFGSEVVGLAHNVDAAIRLVAAHELDAAVLDVNIRGEPSYPVADALAAKSVPYVFATGDGDGEHPKEHAHAPTVIKPYTTADLEQALLRFFG